MAISACRWFFEYFAFLRAEQFLSLRDLLDEPADQLVRTLGPVLIHDVHDQPIVAWFRVRLVAERGEAALQFRQIFADLTLQTLSRLRRCH